MPVPDVREHLRCMICYEIIREPKAVFEVRAYVWAQQPPFGSLSSVARSHPSFKIFPSPSHHHCCCSQCLHRFCKGCAEEAVRKASAAKTMKRSGAECPLCRKNIASKRDL